MCGTRVPRRRVFAAIASRIVIAGLLSVSIGFVDVAAVAQDPGGGMGQAGGQSGGGQAGNGGAGDGQAGGAGLADFSSLIQLIESTVAPDSWETLGGTSTMAPYPQGVMVDASNTLRKPTVAPKSRALAELDQLLGMPGATSGTDWRAKSPMRCVSLRRLRDRIAKIRAAGKPLSLSVQHLAGLSRVQYLIITDDDIVLAAPVGGVACDGGWYLDRESGRAVLRTDFLTRCLASTLSGMPFGCTIDPTPDGMQAAMQVAAKIQRGDIPIGKGPEQIRQSLGSQRVEVFGTASDSAAALLMVEADRHMKELALGVQPMPEGVGTYLDAVDKWIAQGPPSGLLLRLWFTAKPQWVRSDADQRVFEIAGDAIQLSGENQRALANGRRGNVTVDPRSEWFVDGFNQHFHAIRHQYPIYNSLESLYRVAGVAELIHRYATDNVHVALADSLSRDDENRDWMMAAPQHVPTIATLHNVRQRTKRHHVLLASGGVLVNGQNTIRNKISTYASLESKQSVTQSRPSSIEQWWWDVSKPRR